MDSLWLIFFLVITVCTLITTIKFSLIGIINFPSNKVVDFISSGYWCFSLFLFIPWLIGDYARGETSPLPWVAFSKAYHQDGIVFGIIATLIVIIVDMWLFWTAGQIYSLKQSPQNSFTSYLREYQLEFKDENFIDALKTLESIYQYDEQKSNKIKVRITRIINLLAGLLLVSQDNAFYRLLFNILS